MKAGFYPKLALEGIRKNRRLYLPYLLACAGMAAMLYILSFLGSTPLLAEIKGARTVQSILNFGCIVLGIFSVIFLFYTNSFLLRRRKKEFGLYNILGMGKGNIGLILLWENLYAALFTLVAGLGLGIALSKLAQLALLNILGVGVDQRFSVLPGALIGTAVVFGIIFLLLLLNGLRQLHFTDPVALLRSESLGEKAPRGNWALGLVGLILLAVAYFMAVTIRDPLDALFWFFVAVIMVILATYLLFIAGSVLLCRLLQKNKRYYYKANHFVSVSSMTFRMKRNGAGLASICILSTMVLVMLGSTACMYIGAEDALHARYPRDLNNTIQVATAEEVSDEAIAHFRDGVVQVVADAGLTPKNVLDYRYTPIFGAVENGVLTGEYGEGMESYALYVVPLEDYNRMMGTDYRLGDGEVLLYTGDGNWDWDTLTLFDGPAWQVAGRLGAFMDNDFDSLYNYDLIFAVTDASETFLEPAIRQNEQWEMQERYYWTFGFDVDAPAEAMLALQDDLWEYWGDESWDYVEAGGLSYSVDSLEENRGDYYGTFGTLFFLGIMLSVVFLFAAVLIIYYKQLSEGYEDQSRFGIMRKVGMTARDIRRSINSQMLTVFLLPLVTAVVHLCFAFPMIEKLLFFMGIDNRLTLLATCAVSVLVFALFYVIVYRITSNAYYHIVSSDRKE